MFGGFFPPQKVFNIASMTGTTVLEIGPEKVKFEIHTQLLQNNSTVFATGDSVAAITDATPEGFNLFAQYMYAATENLWPAQINVMLEAYLIGKELKASSFVSACQRGIESSLNSIFNPTRDRDAEQIDPKIVRALSRSDKVYQSIVRFLAKQIFEGKELPQRLNEGPEYLWRDVCTQIIPLGKANTQKSNNGGLFGTKTTSKGGLFGNTATTSQPTACQFGAATQPSTGGLFSTSTQPTTGGLFGGPAQHASGGLFGAGTNPQDNAAGAINSRGGLFGGQGCSGGVSGQDQKTDLFGKPLNAGSGFALGGSKFPPEPTDTNSVFQPTKETELSGVTMYQSISMMPQFCHSSAEELRVEHYEKNGKEDEKKANGWGRMAIRTPFGHTTSPFGTASLSSGTALAPPATLSPFTCTPATHPGRQQSSSIFGSVPPQRQEPSTSTAATEKPRLGIFGQPLGPVPDTSSVAKPQNLASQPTLFGHPYLPPFASAQQTQQQSTKSTLGSGDTRISSISGTRDTQPYFVLGPATEPSATSQSEPKDQNLNPIAESALSSGETRAENDSAPSGGFCFGKPQPKVESKPASSFFGGLPSKSGSIFGTAPSQRKPRVNFPSPDDAKDTAIKADMKGHDEHGDSAASTPDTILTPGTTRDSSPLATFANTSSPTTSYVTTAVTAIQPKTNAVTKTTVKPTTSASDEDKNASDKTSDEPASDPEPNTSTATSTPRTSDFAAALAQQREEIARLTARLKSRDSPFQAAREDAERGEGASKAEFGPGFEEKLRWKRMGEEEE